MPQAMGQTQSDLIVTPWLFGAAWSASSCGRGVGCCRRNAARTQERCCRDTEDGSGMLQAHTGDTGSCRALSHGFLTSKEYLALVLTQTNYFISPETFRRKQVLISLETQATDARCLGGVSSSSELIAALLPQQGWASG